MARSISSTEREVTIQAGDASLPGDLAVPDRAQAIVVFAHGSGSSRFSSRNRYVAEVLQDGGMATLLFDLLTPNEERIDQFTREYRFDIPALGCRLTATIDWMRKQPELAELQIGLFGASTGAAAALIAAASRPEEVAAVVSRGGRPDLAGDALPYVKAPSLFIIGGLDTQVIQLNLEAKARMTAPCEVEIVHGASHLFEEPGRLQETAAIARDWLRQHLDVE